MDLKQTLQNGAFKAGAVAVVSGLASVVLANGNESCRVFNTNMPRFVVSGLTMGLSSFAGDALIPVIVPWVSVGSPILKKFENSILSPLLVGVASVAIDSALAPEAISEVGGPVKSVLIGAGSSILSYYVLDSTGLIDFSK